MKRGSVGEWLIVILVMIVIGTIIFFVTTNRTYSKSEMKTILAQTKADILAANKCIMVQLNYGEKNFQYQPQYLGKTPSQICKDLNKEVTFLQQESHHYVLDGTCEEMNEDSFSVGVYESRFAEPSSFEKTLKEPTFGMCRNSGRRVSVGDETSVYSHVLCC